MFRCSLFILAIINRIYKNYTMSMNRYINKDFFVDIESRNIDRNRVYKKPIVDLVSTIQGYFNSNLVSTPAVFLDTASRKNAFNTTNTIERYGSIGIGNLDTSILTDNLHCLYLTDGSGVFENISCLNTIAMGTNIINNTVKYSIVSSIDFAYNYASGVNSCLIFTMGSSINGANNSLFLGNYFDSNTTTNSIVLGENVTTLNIVNSLVLGTSYTSQFRNILGSIVLGNLDGSFDGNDYNNSIILVPDDSEIPNIVLRSLPNKDSYINKSPESGYFGVGTDQPRAKLHVSSVDLNVLVLEGLPVAANEAAAISLGVPPDCVYKTPTGELRIKL